MNLKSISVVELVLFIIKAILMLIQAGLAFVTVIFELKDIWKITCITVGLIALLILFISIMEQVFGKVKGFIPKT